MLNFETPLLCNLFFSSFSLSRLSSSWNLILALLSTVESLFFAAPVHFYLSKPLTYRKKFSDFLNTPLGGSFATIFFLWFALSGWIFRVIIVATWVLPISGPLLIGAVANNFVIKGECPACKRQFIGYKSQIIRCEGCRNVVWQPQGDFFSRDGSNNKNSKGNSKKPPKSQIIDVDFEEK